jgi:hypothetical protein
MGAIANHSNQLGSEPDHIWFVFSRMKGRILTLIEKLTNEDLYEGGCTDAYILSCPQCRHPKCLEGWEATCKKLNKDSSIS